jgi:hypothetical protein
MSLAVLLNFVRRREVAALTLPLSNRANGYRGRVASDREDDCQPGAMSMMPDQLSI